MASLMDEQFEEHNAEVQRNRSAKALLLSTHPRSEFCPVCQQPAPCDVRRILQILDDYEDGITWETNCIHCARMWNDNYAQHEQIEKLKHLQTALNKDRHRLRTALTQLRSTSDPKNVEYIDAVLRVRSSAARK